MKRGDKIRQGDGKKWRSRKTGATRGVRKGEEGGRGRSTRGEEKR